MDTESPESKRMFEEKNLRSIQSSFENGKYLREFTLLDNGKCKGKGSYSSVYSVGENMTGRTFALKVMKSHKYRNPVTLKPIQLPHSKYYNFEIKTRSKTVIEDSLRELRKSCGINNFNLGSSPVIRLFQFWCEEVELKADIHLNLEALDDKSNANETGFETSFLDDEDSVKRTYVTYSFLVMELGETDLWTALKEKQITLDYKSCCRILMNISKSLAQIHEFGLRHNDFKTNNIIALDYKKAFSNPRGIVISDFGLPTNLNEVNDLDGFKGFFYNLVKFCPELGEKLPLFYKEVETVAMVEEYLVQKSKLTIAELYIFDEKLRDILAKMEKDLRKLSNEKVVVLEKKVNSLTEENKILRKQVEEMKKMQRRRSDDDVEDENIVGKKSKRRDENNNNNEEEEEKEKEGPSLEPPMKKRKLD